MEDISERIAYIRLAKSEIHHLIKTIPPNEEVIKKHLIQVQYALDDSEKKIKAICITSPKRYLLRNQMTELGRTSEYWLANRLISDSLANIFGLTKIEKKYGSICRTYVYVFLYLESSIELFNSILLYTHLKSKIGSNFREEVRKTLKSLIINEILKKHYPILSKLKQKYYGEKIAKFTSEHKEPSIFHILSDGTP